MTMEAEATARVNPLGGGTAGHGTVSELESGPMDRLGASYLEAILLHEHPRNSGLWVPLPTREDLCRCLPEDPSSRPGHTHNPISPSEGQSCHGDPTRV